MYCSNCGSPVDEHQFCCTSCGKRIEHTDHDPYVPYQKTRPVWFYVIVAATLVLSIWGFYSVYNSGKSLENIVDTQLTEIRNRQLTKSYYEYSSSEFKKNTPFDAFRNFIDKNSVLSNFKALKILNSKQDSNFGVVTVELTLPDNTRVPIKYEFIREEGEWRILRIEIEDHQFTHELVENEQYIEPIKAQLTAIKENKLENAYESNTSEAFKKNTTPKQFSEFIKKFPILSNYASAEFLNSSLKNNQAIVTIVLHDDNKSLPIEYTLIEEEGKWQIWSMRILTPSGENRSTDSQTAAPLAPAVTKMLAELKSGDLKAAYQGTSSGFKAVTSYEKFENFLKRFPVFREGNFTVQKESVDQGIGKVQVEIKSQEETALVEYTLSKEHDTWTIWGIQIVKQTPNPSTELSSDREIPFDDSFLTKEIKGFLENVKNRDLAHSYNDFTSSEFRAATNYDQFARFIEQNKIFALQQNAEFGSLTFDNNIGTMIIKLTVPGGAKFQVKFDLVKEDDRWKILGIKILSDHEE